MKVLAVDTTTERESVAMVEGGVVLGEVRLRRVDTHSRRLLPAVEFLLGGLGLAPGDVEGYAVTCGPGSFTGLRVGLSTVQGLALASGRPCLGVSALDVIAARIRGAAPVLVAWVDAYRGEVYGGLYDAAGHPLGPAAAAAPGDALASVPEHAAFAGDGAERYREDILAARPRAVFPERSLFLAGTLGLLAEPRLAAGDGVRPEDLRPMYLREAHIRGAAPA
jgi:tRNA threonylcarbamoyladenosine biosynthesis protein TsaB